MKVQLTSVKMFIADLPPELQAVAAQAIKEEKERFERGDFTDQERAIHDYCEAAGRKLAQAIDAEIMAEMLG